MKKKKLTKFEMNFIGITIQEDERAARKRKKRKAREEWTRRRIPKTHSGLFAIFLRCLFFFSSKLILQTTQVLSTCLEELAEENVKLLQKVKTTADAPAEVSPVPALAPSQVDDALPLFTCIKSIFRSLCQMYQSHHHREQNQVTSYLCVICIDWIFVLI